MPTKTPTKKPAAKSHARAKDQTQISISLSKDLLAQIDKCADADSRTRSNWITQKLVNSLGGGDEKGNGVRSGRR